MMRYLGVIKFYRFPDDIKEKKYKCSPTVLTLFFASCCYPLFAISCIDRETKGREKGRGETTE